jgi:hypothetical protein
MASIGQREPFGTLVGRSKLEPENNEALKRANCIPCESGRQEGSSGVGACLSEPRIPTFTWKHRFVELPICANLQRSKRTQNIDFRICLNWVRGAEMLWTLFVVLLVLWLLGMVSSYTLGGFIHILLVLALVALVFQLISGRRTTI